MNIQPRHIRKVVVALGIACIAFLLVFAVLLLSHVLSSVSDEKVEVQEIPKEIPFAFKASKEAYNAIGDPLLHLEHGLSLTKLPDLRSFFIFYGLSKRPDADEKTGKMVIGIRNLFPAQAMAQEEKIYLKYNGPVAAHRWTFSEGNSETAIWIEPEYKEKTAFLHLKMKDAQGNIISQPAEYATFALQQMAPMNTNEPISGWKIGDSPVDTGLLIRQGARWYGKDLFLETYGQKDYPFASGTLRVEFQQPEPYAIYLKEGDAFVNENDSWVSTQLGPETVGKDLLYVKKITDNVISFDIWDKEGRHKISVDLPRAPDPGFIPQDPDVKLVGARSRTHWIVEFFGERTLVKDDDWFIYTAGSCEKISSIDMLDDYLRGDLQGELIILTGVTRKNNSFVLVGERFSASRTASMPFSIQMAKVGEEDIKSPQEEHRTELRPNSRGASDEGQNSNEDNAKDTNNENDDQE